ncbi:hypothetical protein [Thioalkalivibrio sp. XN8]|uniref:hypothetical protein n=1 Tax=Thioalkalivibrio sp. XN8 TaxID=2712863 RepID=UPI0013E9F07A|nr:hypothetical protein [Thioalkalivibrio sp. XN8]NGP52123.1 hypothetical protein [Thioalkalivibrio sp. XN8]
MSERETIDRFDDRIKAFKGQLPTLESAIGAYVTGRKLGWKVLYLVHDKRTIRKYEEILGIRFRDELPADGEHADKSLAWVMASKLSNFWKAVSGELKFKDKKGKEHTVRDPTLT